MVVKNGLFLEVNYHSGSSENEGQMEFFQKIGEHYQTIFSLLELNPITEEKKFIMQQLAINNQFPYFASRKRNPNQSTKQTNFESVISLQTEVKEYRDSDYYLDSISAFAENQSLTPEQIAKKQAESINSEINALRSKFEIANFEEVKKFLSKNRFLISLLEEIPGKIYQYFSKQSKN